MAKNGPKVVNRPHPRGSKGTKVSVSEIVRKVEQGRLDPKTRAWSIETLHRGNLGGFGTDKVMQAKAIFDRLKKERVYVEDPVDSDFMQSSACTLDGCDGLKFLGGDCDDLVIAFLAAIESVGIEGALVAHSYDSSRQHTHVLAAVRDDKRKKWVRCDPSADDPFGTVSKPTRETFYGIPGGKVLADKNGTVDVKKVRSALGNARATGDFVGVGKPFGLGEPEEEPQTANPALEGISDAFRQYMRQETSRIVTDMEQAWYRLKYRHEQMVLAVQMMNELTGGGYSLVEPEIAVPGESSLPNWTKEMEAYYQDLNRYVPVMIRYGLEAANGTRDLLWDEDGVYGKMHDLGYESSSIIVTGAEGEPFVGMNTQDRRIVVAQIQPAAGDVGHWALYVGAIAVGAVIAYLAVREVCDTAESIVAANQEKRTQQFLSDQAAKYGPEKAKEMLEEINKGAAARAAAKVEQDKVSPFSKVADTANTALNALVVIGVGAAAVYGISVAADLFKNRRRASA